MDQKWETEQIYTYLFVCSLGSNIPRNSHNNPDVGIIRSMCKKHKVKAHIIAELKKIGISPNMCNIYLEEMTIEDAWSTALTMSTYNQRSML